MQVQDKTKEQRIDEIVDDLVKIGKLLYICNSVKDKVTLVGLPNSYRAKIMSYREELKQLFRDSNE